MTQRIVDSLSALYANHSVVFWHDADGEFSAAVDALPLQGVQLVRTDSMPALQVKLNIERATGQKWLLYSNQPQPEPTHDWLLDIRLRSKTFSADAASILLEDLGLASQTLRAHLKLRAKFLRSKERVEKLKRLVVPTDTADDLDRKMLAVLARADQPDLSAILLRLFSALVVNGDADLGADSRQWQDILSNELEAAFWMKVAKEFGYSVAEPTLRDLLFHLFATDFSRALSGCCPGQLTHFVLSNNTLAGNAAVFIGRWRSDMAHFASYNALSHAVSNELDIAGMLGALSGDALSEVMTFAVVEQRIIKYLKDRIIAASGAESNAINALIARRRDGHWANRLLAQGNDTSRALAASYDALEAAYAFFELKSAHEAGFSFINATEGLSAYQSGIFRFDQLYRQFNYAAAAVEPMGWAVLHELIDRIESAYSGWFIPQLTSAWSKVIEGDAGLLKSWRIPEWVNQANFYTRHVKPVLDGGAKRVFVVISDAFRYEAAEELVRIINGRNRLKASLSGMLGVLPSYTALGMASLLPHGKLAYKLNSNLDLSADGSVVSTIEQRSTHLEQYGGVAIKAEDLLALGKDKGREFVRDRQVVYIYHDRIDLIGDKQASETKTFEAVSDALTELGQLAAFIINSLNGSVVLMTADHGFMYQESALDNVDKSTLDEKPTGMLRAKKRFLIGQGIGNNPKVWCGNTSMTAGTEVGEGSVDFWLPKGAARFHFAGGARFVHGSAMPQEIVIPVITLRVSESDNAKTSTVEFSLLGASNKVVTNKQRFEFIQTEAISERVLTRTVQISIRDGETLISDEQSLTFDSDSELMDKRKRTVMLTVRSGSYDRNKDYYLIARDAQTKVEVLRSPLRVDLAFANDF
ncbi:MAG: BREX-1 system phosphatase PglZ type A [Gallionella sp.]|nr:BREX-1 system phosphatase PglZ type A [Gallionella sp.]MDD4946828.1 BREX-1 system phosphatase PglZ type A [Gallionella sp.]